MSTIIATMFIVICSYLITIGQHFIGAEIVGALHASLCFIGGKFPSYPVGAKRLSVKGKSIARMHYDLFWMVV